MRIRDRFLFLFLGLLLALGCASSGPAPKVITPLQEDVDLSSYRSFDVEVVAADDVELSSHVLARVRDRIIEKIHEDHPGRFSPSGPESGSPFVRARVEITRYDEGSALARSMLAGLGQIHIDADVFLYDSDTSDLLAQYEVTKTFAWGGIYGGGTSIEDVETGFAESVAEAISR